MDFRFTNEYSPANIDAIVGYLLGPRLWIPGGDYPDFLDWAGRTWFELQKENKRAMLAFHQRELVGVTIYQRYKKDKKGLEIKNLTVRPDKAGRYIASFLLRNAEIEGAKEFGSDYVICDAKAKHWPIKLFLFRHHYRIAAKTELYSWDAGSDFVYCKNLDKKY